MHRASWHTFQVLTKRSERLLELGPQIDWPDNVWMGVSVETQTTRFGSTTSDRPAPVPDFCRWNHCSDPYHAWICETSTGSSWAVNPVPAQDRFRRSGCWRFAMNARCSVPFFFKQWGGVRKKSAGRLLEGRTWDAMPLPMGA